MAEKIKFSINKETLFRNETKDFILTRVPNSKGMNYAAFNKKDIVRENQKTYIVELDKDVQIAMWKGEPRMAFAEAAQTHGDYTHKDMVRLSAGELYDDYYIYSKASDPSVKKRRQEREQQYDNQKQVPSKGEAQGQESSVQENVSANQDTKAEEKKPEINHFDNRQMAELLKGMMQGVDIKKYMDVEMDAAKMKELRLGLKAGVDVSRWNNKDISAQAMRELRLGERKGARRLLDIKDIDISKYDAAQIHELILGSQQNLDINKYLNSEYDAAQMREFRLGLKAGLDISKYQDIHFSADQMRIVRHRLVFQRIAEILKSFLQEARIWLSERGEHLADMLSQRVSPPTVKQILEEVPPEQSPVEQIKEILIKSELVREASLQNEAVNELLNRKVSDMIAEISEGSKPEQAVIEETASAMLESAGADMENNVIYLNHNTFTKEHQKETPDIWQPETAGHLDEEAIRQQTEEYVEQMNTVVIEEAMAMEG